MFSTRTAAFRFLALLGLVVGLLAAGCGQPQSPGAPPASGASAASAAVRARELWDVCYLQHAKAGYTQTRISTVNRGEQALVRVECASRMRVMRDAQATEQSMSYTSLETAEGKLLEIDLEMVAGPVPIRTHGQVEGGRLRLSTSSQGKTIASEVAWSESYGGPYAVEESLARRPLQPGEQRTIQALLPGSTTVIAEEITARDYETVALRATSARLLRLDTVSRFPNGMTIAGKAWMDPAGDILKSQEDALNGIESYRTTKADALDERGLGAVDLTASLSVKTDRPLQLAHRAHKSRYRITVRDADPCRIFEACPSQQVQAAGANIAEVTVYALRPSSRPAPPPSTVTPPPGDEDRQPNNMVQSDDPLVVALARQAVGEATAPWAKAVALERFVHNYIVHKDYSQAFATALEVVQSRTGDCTEHSVLLVALARAQGIPARSAIGLVYVEGMQAFAFHMWAELYIEGQWIPMDATLGQGGIGGGHLKLAHTSLKSATADTAFLPVVQVAGRMQIAVLSEE